MACVNQAEALNGTEFRTVRRFAGSSVNQIDNSKMSSISKNCTMRKSVTAVGIPK